VINSRSSPPTIGVFDSGFGGLTVLRALIERLPQVQFAFLGDTARLPYGSKSRRTIARYAAESAQFLVREQGAEFLVIACNTASALALDSIQDAVSVPVLGVIEPGAAAARAESRTGDVLVIATDATVQSHAYTAACRVQGLRTLEKACPLLVPLVEEGWVDPLMPTGCVTDEIIRIYLAELTADAAAQGLNPDVLVLGCTHYPLLRPLIERAVPETMRVIDSAAAAAEAALGQFGDPGDADPPRAPQVRCFATDSVEKFERLGSRFLGHPVGKVQLVDLGG
jgi:glutamate racemase